MIRILKYLLLLLAIISVAGFLYLNTIFKTQAEKIASRMTGTKVTITYASISPFSGNIVIGGLSVANPTGFKAKNAIEFDSISASIDMKSTMQETIKITKVELKNPVIYYEIGLNGDNIRALLGNVKAGSRSSGGNNSSSGGTKKKVVIDDLYLINCKARLAADLFGLHAGQEFNVGDIHLRNVGGANDGTSIENITLLVLQKIAGEITKLKASGFVGKIEGQFKNLKGSSLKQIENLF